MVLHDSAATSKLDKTSAEDLGVYEPKQVVLEKYPLKAFIAQRRSFSSSWYKDRPWLEYSVNQDAAFCFTCRKYTKACFNYTEAVFISKGYYDWKHATCTSKGFDKHASSKEHLMCDAMWRECANRIKSGTKISTLLISDQLARNRY